MPDEKKEMSKEEKLEKARELMAELNKLELSEEELKSISGGADETKVNPQVVDDESVGIGMSGKGTF